MSQDGRRGQYLFVNGSQQQQKQRSGAINVELICFFSSPSLNSHEAIIDSNREVYA